MSYTQQLDEHTEVINQLAARIADLEQVVAMYTINLSSGLEPNMSAVLPMEHLVSVDRIRKNADRHRELLAKHECQTPNAEKSKQSSGDRS